jgi:hypothetical protein
MSSFSLRDNLTIENGKALKWLDATGTSRRDILTLDGFNAVKVNSAGADIYINSSVNSTTWVNSNNTNNVVVGSRLGIGTSTVSNVLSLSTNSVISTDSTTGSLSLTAARDTSSANSSKIILNASGTGGNLDLYSSTVSGSGLRFYSGTGSLKRFHIYDTGLFNFTPDGSTIVLSVDSSNLTSVIPFLLQNTTTSTTTSTGALIVNGGVAIQRALNVGGGLSVLSTTNTVSLSSGSIWNSGTLASANGTIANLVGTSLTTSTLFITGTTNSVAISSGSISGVNSVISNLTTGTINTISLSSGSIWNSGTLASVNGTIANLVGTSLTSSTLTITGTTNSVAITSGSIFGLNSVISNLTTGTLTVSGGINLLNTIDAAGIGSGGGLTVFGGAAISKRLFANTLSLGSISNEFSGSFVGNNNVSSPADITGLSFSTTDTRSFTITMAISIVASASLYSQAVIEGIWKNGAWEIFTSSLGDATGITFSITSTGQLRYISLNYTSWSSTTFRWTAKVINQAGTHIPPTLPTTGAQTITGPLTITSSTNAVSGSTGALTVAGGMGIGGDLIVGGNIFSNIYKTQIATSSFSVTGSHKNWIFLVSNSITITLLSAITAGANFTVSFSKGDTLENSIQIVPATGETIEGFYTNYLLTNFNDLVTFISDGTGWRILQSRAVTFANIYSLPGIYYFTVPNPITKIYACVFGAGGGGGSGTLGTSSGNGGGGGGYTEGLISVTPGETLTITVGAGGNADSPGEESSIGELVAGGGGNGNINIIGNWGTLGSPGSGSGGLINRNGGSGGQSPSQFTGGGGGGGCAGRSSNGSSGNGYLGGNGSGGLGATVTDSTGGSIRITNFYREGGGGASGNIDTAVALGSDGGFPGGGGSGSSDGSGGRGADGCIIIYY